MKKRIDRINNFRFPISQPTVFDEEEKTVLELTSVNARKTNELVDYLNNVLDGEITEQIAQKISKGVIDGLYVEDTETLLLKFTYDNT